MSCIYVFYTCLQFIYCFILVKTLSLGYDVKLRREPILSQSFGIPPMDLTYHKTFRVTSKCWGVPIIRAFYFGNTLAYMCCLMQNMMHFLKYVTWRVSHWYHSKFLNKNNESNLKTILFILKMPLMTFQFSKRTFSLDDSLLNIKQPSFALLHNVKCFIMILNI